MWSYRKLFATAALVAVVLGCTRSQQGPERLKTVPVKGTVTVKGMPAIELTVKFRSLATPQGEAAIYAANPTALTDADGTFVVSTYEHGDGLAAGEYVITFEWLKFDRLSNSYGGPDRLGGKYADPKTSEFKLTVTGDEEAIALEPFHLTM
ncbi:MAG: hypothetical protein H0T47_07955 [Planctomycetaceae bacterium]|nr:hypothetical protein [Planctomycetaceae bacterium]